MRPATLEERRLFYEKEFRWREARRWVRSFVKVDTGRHTGIAVPGEKKRLLMLRPFRDLRERLIHYLPEDVYYDRNSYLSLNRCTRCKIFFGLWHGKYCWWSCRNVMGQELAFDLDPENLTEQERGSIYSFTAREFEETRRRTLELVDWLSDRFTKLIPVYSGRGFHVVVRDRDAFLFTMEQRQALVEELPPGLAEVIDPWVTRGNIRLLRLPYSLHGLVSRVATPLSKKELEKEDLLDRFKPRYL